MDKLNTARPMIMHVDLNSCFATIEQQSRPMLRNKPVAVVNRLVKNATIITASYEAKGRGVKTGMRLMTALLLCPALVVVESDPPKYRFVYRKLMAILQDYSPSVQMKSIDEGLIDFSNSPPGIRSRRLEGIGREIKQRLKDEIGEHMRCNIGVATNRFLAKTAAGLNKPDGLDVITYKNLKDVYEKLELEDLTGIAKGYAGRLGQIGINSPLDFLEASEATLVRQVFRSKCGSDWYRRLRGWEVDGAETSLKTVGRQFVLDRRDLGYDEVLKRFYSLGEDVVAKLRRQQVKAHGVRIYVKNYNDGRWQNFWRQSRAFDDNESLMDIVRRLLQTAPLPAHEIGVTCYGLVSSSSEQYDLFGEIARSQKLSRAIDEINSSWGSGTVHSATTLGVGDRVKSKISFGSVRYF